MQKTKDYNKYTKAFIVSIFVLTFFDAAIVVSSLSRSIIYLAQGIWIAPVLQFIPFLFFSTLLIFEIIFITKYYKQYKKVKNEQLDDKKMVAFDKIVTENPKSFKREMIFIYISCAFTVCLGGLGIIPLVFLIKGKNAQKEWNDQQINVKLDSIAQ